MQSYYEINVSFGGMHFFATAPRSCVTENVAVSVYNKIREKFPKSEGYEVTVRYWKASATHLEW